MDFFSRLAILPFSLNEPTAQKDIPVHRDPRIKMPRGKKEDAKEHAKSGETSLERPTRKLKIPEKNTPLNQRLSRSESER
jgi:hypothetical protein